jgi:hypothetical protein
MYCYSLYFIQIRNHVSFIYNFLGCSLREVSLRVHFNYNPATSTIMYFINDVTMTVDKSHFFHCLWEKWPWDNSQFKERVVFLQFLSLPSGKMAMGQFPI